MQEQCLSQLVAGAVVRNLNSQRVVFLPASTLAVPALF